MHEVRKVYYRTHNSESKHVACPGDPPHARQLVLKDILELPRFAKIIVKAKYISKTFKNTRCKQFLKLHKDLDVDKRCGNFSFNLYCHASALSLSHL
jgi:hypothetical protein